ncbi:MAG: FAD binding domain-containing protein [Xanthobacteraceae bacterium]|nr:FAD binding domain-containing protein [Xanthobacteraceae bacterium]
MKPAPFDYVRPASIDEACAALAVEESVVIAGGQTLIPILAMRLARPARLVDIARIPGLAGIREEGDAVVIGATTRQVEAERSAVIAARVPLLARALPFVGHAPTRNRGTLGGSVANADPAAEIPLVLVTLGGGVAVRDGRTTQEIAAQEFVLGPMMTALATGALVVGLRFPVWPDRRIGVGFHEVSTRASDFAFAAAAAQIALDASGRCTKCAIGIGAATPRPVRLDALATKLIGSTLDDTDIRAGAADAVAELEIMVDSHASPDYRRRAAKALAVRALTDARDAARGVPA